MARAIQSTPVKAAKRSASKPSPAPKASGAPKPSKDELRARVELLERTIATLRAKNRELRAAAKAATSQVANMETPLAQQPQQRAPKRTRQTRPSRERDPGDAVPPGVAVLEPQPMDAEARAAHDALEEHLGSEAHTNSINETAS